ncbi:hypothetical protein HBI56_035330 [Parastagonospora nodorum]|uniref:AMP-dependent synthetase/ligase domain-containing protein n=1 Tax=Phaeosphaeria nodorum (strain SN15 / ATCC MYA-4574 / FGSC 10173) TaxID=321614 RepID=A0A7U2HVU9_PHANO|nr:hypothetical protein HBH56_071500 [Parastagonospora nodorum]QRC93765.1 hypothetical protein JI435_039530 [Parastagonospora nodorum SN15]KAH3932203.1 hypothetical protein HBH54_076630 [Parastagonospora nodorum]KAH3988453.1 hypothetical protein HBH51_000220 [Parastagonospora nodorum]KAH4004527.1 hypothetical protein HBI10_038700 [Parastagonospora nodorum]
MSCLPQEERTIVSRLGRGQIIPVPYKSIHEAFEGIVKTHPTVIAATIAGQTLTYLQLDVAANRLAHCMIHSGLKPGERVCLVVRRSFEMLVGIFAILKAGCQYVPIDGGVTSEQAFMHIFNDSEARFILCLPQFWDKIRRFARKDAVMFALTMDIGAFFPATKPTVQVSSRDAAYAIYTSGSTGKPKGVNVSHGNVTNALLLEPARLGITVGSKVAQVLNIAFDMGAWEILGCLMNGGTLYMRGSDWTSTLSEVDTLITTPSILCKYRRRSYPGIKHIATGGEICPQSLADEWAENSLCFINICGPTEITILNTAHRHTPGQPLTIGKPIPNTTCYILDDDEQPVRMGQKGTMWVGGAGVSRGYINLSTLTSHRYKPDKFMDDGSMMFNTGDIARWRVDGSLDMLGRKDDQVKIKGFRVELDGVTQVIEKFPGIRRGTAMLIEGVLCGFYANDDEISVDEPALEAFVRKHLPYYSVPEKWMHVGSIPLTANGKVDRKQLSETTSLQRSRPDSDTDASQGELKYASIEAALEIRPSETNTREHSQDTEKGKIFVTSQASELEGISDRESVDKVIDILPPIYGPRGLRWLRHRAFILYRRFFSVVVLSNVSVASIILYREARQQKKVLPALATATASNLVVAVLIRWEPVINLLFTTFCSVPTCFPLAIRRHCARIFHIGGIHSGCAIAAIMWHCAFTIAGTLELGKAAPLRRISLAPIVLSYLGLVILVLIGLTSHPAFRAKYHNAWEAIHRFGGWTCLILLWALTALATKDLNPTVAPSVAYASSPSIWLLAVATAAVIFPWLFLRKVPVRSEVLSHHAVRLWFDYTTPVVGTSVRLAERPLVDWHGFATITNPNGKGFSLIVSRAGDFTGRTIERAPSHVYVRGIPACGVLRIATLFKSVVLVATGSGIGPCLAVILARKVPCRILWTAPNPEQTFGMEIVDSVRATDPQAIIWNTRTQGKPDMSLLAYKLWKESGAEAVCVISNKKFTTTIVYDMESRGIPAYGAIFDS